MHSIPLKALNASRELNQSNLKRSNEKLLRRITKTDKPELLLHKDLHRIFNEHVEYIPTPTTTSELLQRIIREDSKGTLCSLVVVDLGRLVAQVVQWGKYLPRVEPFYAVKSNPDVNILRSLLVLGVSFDCASRGEIEMVLKVGAAPHQIIFANPAKTSDSIHYSKSKGVHKMTFDNAFELNKILDIFPNAELLLRISAIDVSGHPLGYKFGANQEEAHQLIALCAQKRANLVGISFHIGSRFCSSASFIATIQRAREMFNEAEQHGFRLTVLDIGGGFPGDMDGSISFAKIASDIGPVINTLFPEPHIQVIAEPGRYFCTTTMSVAMQVYSKRDYTSRRVDPHTNESQIIKEVQYFCPDGVYGNFNNILFDDASPIARPLVEPPVGSVLYNTTFFGPTCDSFDVIAKNVEFPLLELGDWVYFTNMGAYTSASGSCFNGIEKPTIFYKILDQGFKTESNIPY